MLPGLSNRRPKYVIVSGLPDASLIGFVKSSSVTVDGPSVKAVSVTFVPLSWALNVQTPSLKVPLS